MKIISNDVSITRSSFSNSRIQTTVNCEILRMRVKFESVLNLRNGPTINFHVIEIENRETNLRHLGKCRNRWSDFFSEPYSVLSRIKSSISDYLSVFLFENFFLWLTCSGANGEINHKDECTKIHSCLFTVLSTSWLQWDPMISEEGIANPILSVMTFATTSPYLSAYFSLILCWKNFYLHHTYLKRMFVALFCNHLTNKSSA